MSSSISWGSARSDLILLLKIGGGVEPLLDSVGAELRVQGRQALGILVDANTNLSARWDAVKARLSREGIELPGRSAAGGITVTTAAKLRVGVWLMPDNTSSGELEDFVVQMMPPGDPVWPLSQRYIDAVPEQHRKFSTQKSQRAKLHAWLAARENPRRMGSAIGARDLEVGGALCNAFVAWLQVLFT